MKIKRNKIYRVRRFTMLDETDLGFMIGKAVRKLLRKFKYHEKFELYIDKDYTVTYEVTEYRKEINHDI